MKSKLMRRRNDKKAEMLQRRIEKISDMKQDCFNEGKIAKLFSAAKRQASLMAIALGAWYDGIRRKEKR
jgi:hypothetical protein